MRVDQLFDEIQVFEGIAQRTGVHVGRGAVRHNSGVCRSLSELIRKARFSGDGLFYLPVDLWPPQTEHVEIQRPWTVIP